MSNAAINWAYEQDTAPGPKFVLVTLADVCDDSGVTFRGQHFLRERTGFSKRTIVAHMNALEEAGLIARLSRRRANGSKTSDYTLLGPGGGDRGKMAIPDHDEVPAALVEMASGADSAHADIAPGQVQISHHQSPTVEPSGEGGERARGKLKISGKPVRAEAWSLTERILAEFNSQTGRDLRLLTSAGLPSDAAKRIYGRVIAYPDIDFEKHRSIIERTLASKWWCKNGADERASVGVVYGPNVFEENITRRPTVRQDRDADRKALDAKRLAALRRVTGQEPPDADG